MVTVTKIAAVVILCDGKFDNKKFSKFNMQFKIYEIKTDNFIQKIQVGIFTDRSRRS